MAIAADHRLDAVCTWSWRGREERGWGEVEGMSWGDENGKLPPWRATWSLSCGLQQCCVAAHIISDCSWWRPMLASTVLLVKTIIGMMPNSEQPWEFGVFIIIPGNVKSLFWRWLGTAKTPSPGDPLPLCWCWCCFYACMLIERRLLPAEVGLLLPQRGRSYWSINPGVINHGAAEPCASLAFSINKTEQRARQNVRRPYSVPNIKFTIRLWLCFSALGFPKPGVPDLRITTEGASYGLCFLGCLGPLTYSFFKSH